MNRNIEQLAEYFLKFPGIGPRQAKRFVYHLLLSPAQYRSELAKKILDLGGAIAQCSDCKRYYDDDRNPNGLCSLCGNTKRDAGLLMIVEKDVDCEAIERSDTYMGYYFILGGTVSISGDESEDAIRLDSLMTLIEKRAEGGLQEIVLATSANPDGEHTARFIASRLRELKEKYGFTVSLLGRGLSTGTELEYSDKDTIQNALENRKQNM